MRKFFIISTLIFIGLFLTSASGEKTQGIKAKEESIRTERQEVSNDLLQFSAGGHVLGFRKGEVLIASADHVLRIEFVNARLLFPKEEAEFNNTENKCQSTKPLGKVTYKNLWDGVTLIYEKHASGVMKSTYYIQPTADENFNPAAQIHLRYNVPVKVDDYGNLFFSFETGKIRESPPIAWQEIRGKRVPVQVSFLSLGEREVGFGVGSYDPNFPLVIDPVLSWNTFMGSANDDEGHAIAVDSSGNVYVTGYSDSSWGTPVNAFAGDRDAFAAKFDSNGALVWNTFLGSINNDYSRAIAVDSSGNVYVAGYSYNTWGAPVNPYAGSSDVFAAQLDSNGVLMWNTFMGSASSDIGRAIAVDSSGNAYVAGYSDSSWGIPLVPHAGLYDAFAAKLNSNGVRQWNTFMGSATFDNGYAIAADINGNVYVTGYSDSSWGAPVNAFAGDRDVFVAMLNSNGVRQWNTFMGSISRDEGSAITTDNSGNVYMAGRSFETWGTPVNAHSGNYDAFVAQLNNSGSLVWNTFMGSANDDQGSGIAIDAGGNVYLSGDGSATWGTPLIPYAGSNDAFVAMLNSNGVRQWNAFLGSISYDKGMGIAVDTSRNIYVTGYSDSSWGTPVNAHAGGDDAFAAKLGDPEINIRKDTTNIPDGGSVDFGIHDVGTNTDIVFNIENTGGADLTLTTPLTISGANAGEFSVQQQPTSPVAPATSTTFTLRFSPKSKGTKTADLSIGNNDSNENPYDIALTAKAQVIYTLTLASGLGGTTNPPPLTYMIAEGARMTITAIPNTHYRFLEWTGDVPAGKQNENPITIFMDSDKSIKANFIRIIYPPSDFRGQKVLNRSLSQAEYINVLTWQANPNNINIVKYRIYQVDGEIQSLLIESDANTFEYWHRRVDKDKQYTYVIVALNNENREGDPAYSLIQ